MVDQEKGGVRRVNRPRWEGGKGRYIKKLMSKKTWYKKRGGESESSKEGGRRYTNQEGELKPYEKGDGDSETVMFVPSTPKRELVKRLREADCNFRRGSRVRPIKFIERAGVSLRDTLVSSNP